jgi:hypothetical protein
MTRGGRVYQTAFASMNMFTQENLPWETNFACDPMPHSVKGPLGLFKLGTKIVIDAATQI